MMFSSNICSFGLRNTRVFAAKKYVNFSTNFPNFTASLQNDKKNEKPDPLKHVDYFQVAKLFTLKDLFDAKVHFGHHEGCWNPLMKPYLYGSRERYHIFDLNKTVENLKIALNVVSHVAYRKGVILFVSTHPQFEFIVQETARNCDEYFITRQWNLGTFNNSNILLNSSKLPDLVIFLNLPMLGRGMPAVREAAQCNIPCVGIVDSDCDPRLITYPIPGNDDSMTAIQLYCTLFKKTILNAKQMRMEDLL